jgi:hypothetical protein
MHNDEVGFDLEGEGMIVGVEDKEIPEGMCAVIWHDQVIYLGPIGKSRMVPGATIYLNPVDFRDMRSAWHAKRLH